MTNLEMAQCYWVARDEMEGAAGELRAAQHLLVGIAADMAWESHAARTFGEQVDERIEHAHRAAHTCDEYADVYLRLANAKAGV